MGIAWCGQELFGFHDRVRGLLVRCMLVDSGQSRSDGLATFVTQFPDVENVQRHFAATTTTTKIVAKI